MLFLIVDGGKSRFFRTELVWSRGFRNGKMSEIDGKQRKREEMLSWQDRSE